MKFFLCGVQLTQRGILVSSLYLTIFTLFSFTEEQFKQKLLSSHIMIASMVVPLCTFQKNAQDFNPWVLLSPVTATYFPKSTVARLPTKGC